MKEKIHPTYHEKVLVHCACGETFFTRSTVKEIRVEICSKCHPFFTGKQKLVDSAGRVDRFQKRFAATGGAAKPTAQAVSKAAVKAKANATRIAARSAERSKAAAAAKPAKMVPIPPPPARKGGRDGRDGGRG